MVTYEIINPSDPYTIEADDLEVAAIACVVIGDGKYALRAIKDDAMEVPLFAFGGKPDDWFKEKFGRTLQESYDFVTKNKIEALCTCFESVLIGRKNERESFNKGLELITDPAKREEWKEHWHDTRRSSMNDIGGYAWQQAAALRKHFKI